MFARLLLLISIVAPAYADTELSGYAYTTIFSDHQWYDNRSVAAINGDFMYDHVAVRGQASTYPDIPIRRLTIETDTHIPNGELVVKVGRFSRVNGFYDNIVDTPASSHMAILPQSGYSYRLFSGAFSIMDGIKSETSWVVHDNRIATYLSYGHMVIPCQSDLQNEVLHKNIPFLELRSIPGYSAELHDEVGPFHIYIAESMYGVTMDSINSKDRTSNAVAKTYHVVHYHLDKVGIKFENDFWLASTEYFKGNTHAFTQTDVVTYHLDAEDFNVVLGAYVKEHWFVYTSKSHGHNLTAGTSNNENVYGVTYAYRPFTVSVEKHLGAGNGWQKYGVPPSADINSWVSTITYQF